MFDKLRTENLKKFRKDIALEIAQFIKLLRSQNEEFEQTHNYNLLQEFKGQVFENTVPLKSLLRKFEANVSTSEPSYFEIKKLIENLMHALGSAQYKSLIIEDNNKVSLKATSLFSIHDAKNNLSHRLLHQFTSLENLETSKEEVMRLLIKAHESDGYHPICMDVAEVVKTKSLDNLEEFKGTDKLMEILHRENILLFKELDKHIDDALSRYTRIQIILKSANHYCPMDIDLNTMSCFIFDAAGEALHYRLHQISKYSVHIKEVFDATSVNFEHNKEKRQTRLQKDLFSCPLFCIDQSVEAAKIPDLHNSLKRVAEFDPRISVQLVSWTALPPTLVKNSQSTLFLDYYKKLNPEFASTIDKLTNRNQPGYGLTETRRRLTSLLESLCEQKSEVELVRMIESTSSFKTSHAPRPGER